jgi:hypothetical protein
VNFIDSIRDALTPKPPKKERPFQRVEATQFSRTIACWSGILPQAPYARHHLRVVGLTERDCQLELSRTGLRPFRINSHITTEIWLGFRYLVSPTRFRLVFRGQYDFRIPRRSTRSVAEEVGAYLAESVLPKCRHHYQLIEYNEDLHLDCEAIYRHLLTKALSETSVSEIPISFEAFALNPEFYKSRFARD